ncbi:LysR family transcriptional regulator [Ramlibacter sp. 2FC]|uniref:LysR family transcriptional regulator n=1 Tax=Ramlibacter sp. 2FC TaxID=2502188 RepID=UPI0010F61719|nr:LysR family transcriptional regulator [Ramlibacter sp. 2FC]
MDTNPRSIQLLNRLRMRQVSLLLAIEEQGTLRGASAQLGMTQPAATKMLHELEDALGQALFDRVGRGLRLTEAGRCVLAYFHGMRGTLEALGRELKALHQGSAGKLSIGSIMAASPALLTGALIRLKALYPLLSVEITVGTSDRLLELLQQGQLDLVVGRVTGISADEHLFTPVAEEALSVVAAVEHPLAARPNLAFKALLAYPWILQPRGSPLREVMEQEFRSHQAPLPQGLIETASILTTTNLIAQSQMIAVIPETIASRYEQHGLLRVLPYALRHRLESFGSILRRDRPASGPAARFLALLRETAAPLG